MIRDTGRTKITKTGTASMTIMNREERAARRQEIAEAIRDGKQIADVSRKFKVGASTVKSACVEHGVEIPRQEARPAQKPGDDFLQILAWLIEGYDAAEISDDMGCTRQYVSLVKQRAKAMGIFDAIRKLGKEVPERADQGAMTDATKFAVVSLALGGEPQGQIAETCGLHIATVNKIIQGAKAAGLMKFAKESKVRIPKKMQIVAALLNKTTTNHEIAKKFKTSVGLVDVVIREMKEVGIL